ncbi:Arc family DNA-binding protein [uncultured Cohaesibacter sp.]|uniref:Arc family DNA-binding protein n=1 Tax=uncultured Cohaesibacter sp. TaxID=1002546 RepID=UPI0029C89123|nr:Arc family DNA-binding protein [uncultured Cohaesibacter sp.]
MRDRIKDAAKQNGRSMNAEIIHRLESSLAIQYPAKRPRLKKSYRWSKMLRWRWRWNRRARKRI